MNNRNSTKLLILGLFFILSLKQPAVAQVQDSVFNNRPIQEVSSEKNEPEKAGLEKDEEPKEEKANPKLIAAVCLFIITTTLLLYHVRSK